MLNYLYSKTVYSRGQNLDALFLVKAFKNKIGCSLMVTVGFRVPTKQIRDFSIFNDNNASKLSPSTNCVTSADRVCRSLDVFIKHTISLEDTFSFV
jgi:hypothetical protein